MFFVIELNLYFSLGNYGEIVIKTPDEYWITAKTSNEREFYVIIYKKNANLKEIAGNIENIIKKMYSLLLGHTNEVV